jgi:hypothetical protein
MIDKEMEDRRQLIFASGLGLAEEVRNTRPYLNEELVKAFVAKHSTFNGVAYAFASEYDYQRVILALTGSQVGQPERGTVVEWGGYFYQGRYVDMRATEEPLGLLQRVIGEDVLPFDFYAKQR